MYRRVPEGMQGWIVQVNCVKDNHLVTLWFSTLDIATENVNTFRETGMFLSEDDGSITSWPPHLLGCFQMYSGPVAEGMQAIMSPDEVASMG